VWYDLQLRLAFSCEASRPGKPWALSAFLSCLSLACLSLASLCLSPRVSVRLSASLRLSLPLALSIRPQSPTNLHPITVSVTAWLPRSSMLAAVPDLRLRSIRRSAARTTTTTAPQPYAHTPCATHHAHTRATHAPHARHRYTHARMRRSTHRVPSTYPGTASPPPNAPKRAASPPMGLGGKRGPRSVTTPVHSPRINCPHPPAIPISFYP